MEFGNARDVRRGRQNIYACPFAQMWPDMEKYCYCASASESRKSLHTCGVLSSRVLIRKFTRKICRVASVNSQVAASYPRSKSTGSTKCTTLCTTVLLRGSPPRGDSPFVNHHRENSLLLISDFYNARCRICATIPSPELILQTA